MLIVFFELMKITGCLIESDEMWNWLLNRDGGSIENNGVEIGDG